MFRTFIGSVSLRVRRVVLSAIAEIFIGSAIWTEDTRDRYEQIFLSNSTVQQKEHMLVSSATSFPERAFLSLYLRLPLPGRDRGFHVDVCKYILLHLHSLTGLIDPSFETAIDDRIMRLYEPLRHYIANTAIMDENDTEVGKTIVIFRFAKHYATVKDITDSIFKGVTRPVHVLSDTDMSMLYYDVLQSKPDSIADDSTKKKILNGEISIIALSYRHVKQDRRHLGMTKREFISATRALHAVAQEANPPEQYCFWWDSCLRCSARPSNATMNWAAVGLAPYAFCHVLSIRRCSIDNEERLWIDMEQALARLSKGLTAVDVSQVTEKNNFKCAEVIGIAAGVRGDPEYALSEGLVYSVSGDLFESAVTFPKDKVSLNRAGISLLCSRNGCGVYRALFDGSKSEVRWVSSWSDMEQHAFLSTMLIRLGYEQIDEGNGEAYLDVSVRIVGEKFVFNDRRSWLPNSAIYEIESGDIEPPNHVRDQVSLFVKNSETNGRDNMFGLLLYYQQKGAYDTEAVHGCVVNMVSPNELFLAESVSRLHVPRSSMFFGGFVELYSIGKSRSTEIASTERERIYDFLAWLWEENEMVGDKGKVFFEVV